MRKYLISIVAVLLTVVVLSSPVFAIDSSVGARHPACKGVDYFRQLHRVGWRVHYDYWSFQRTVAIDKSYHWNIYINTTHHRTDRYKCFGSFGT